MNPIGAPFLTYRVRKVKKKISKDDGETDGRRTGLKQKNLLVLTA